MSNKTSNSAKYANAIKISEQRQLKALTRKRRSVFAGFGLFGIVGWSIVVPTLGGVALGRWLDQRYPTTFSFTITLLITGISIGCLGAYHWLSKEHSEMHQSQNANVEATAKKSTSNSSIP